MVFYIKQITTKMIILMRLFSPVVEEMEFYLKYPKCGYKSQIPINLAKKNDLLNLMTLMNKNRLFVKFGVKIIICNLVEVKHF